MFSVTIIFGYRVHRKGKYIPRVMRISDIFFQASFSVINMGYMTNEELGNLSSKIKQIKSQQKSVGKASGLRSGIDNFVSVKASNSFP